MFGVDTSERREPCFDEATERLRELSGGMVRVEVGSTPTDRYNRLLYYLYTEGGASIDAALIREGLAKAWTRDGQHRDYLVALQATAQADGIGCLSKGAPPLIQR